MDDDSDDAQLVALPARNANGEGKEVVPETGEGQSVAATVTVTVSRPEKVTYRGHTFVLESAISQRLKQLFISLEVDAEEHVTLDQALYVCQHTDLPDVDIANMCGLVVPDKSNADTIACDEFVALMSMVCLAQQRGLVSPRSLGELERLDGTVLVDVGLSDGDRTFAVEPPSHLELGEVRVDNIKSRSSGSGIYRHILYDITFSLGYGWDHVGINRTRVQRRYSDFVWLQERFLSKYAAVILPPLPAKKMVGNLDAQFVESRRQALEFYLNRIGEHTLLRSSLEFCVFISSTPRGMDALHKFCAPLKTTSWSESAKGLVSSVWSTFGNYVPLVGGGGGGKGPAADSKGDSTDSASGDNDDADATSSSASTALAVVAAAPTAVDQQDRGFAKMHEKFATCHAHLQRILGRTEDLTKHRRSMGLQVAFLGHAVSEIGAAEKSMRLRGTEGISLVGELLEKVAKLEQDTNDSFEATHVAQLKFHLGTLDMAQALLESRKDLFQQEREAYRKRLAAKKAYAAARAGGSSGGAAADSKQRAEREIQDSVQRVTAATRGIEKEVGRFEASKANNLRAMLQATAEVMQQSNRRQKLLWADLARVLSTLSFQNGGGGSGGANSASTSACTSSASSTASAGGGSGGGSIGSGDAGGGRGGRAGDDDSTSRSSTPIYSDDSGSSQYE